MKIPDAKQLQYAEKFLEGYVNSSEQLFIDVLKALNIEDKKSLIVFGAPNNNVYLSSRNFKGSEVVTSSEISTYKILNAKELVISESSLLSINENLSK